MQDASCRRYEGGKWRWERSVEVTKCGSAVFLALQIWNGARAKTLRPVRRDYRWSHRPGRHWIEGVLRTPDLHRVQLPSCPTLPHFVWSYISVRLNTDLQADCHCDCGGGRPEGDGDWSMELDAAPYLVSRMCQVARSLRIADDDGVRKAPLEALLLFRVNVGSNLNAQTEAWISRLTQFAESTSMIVNILSFPRTEGLIREFAI